MKVQIVLCILLALSVGCTQARSQKKPGPTPTPANQEKPNEEKTPEPPKESEGTKEPQKTEPVDIGGENPKENPVSEEEKPGDESPVGEIPGGDDNPEGPKPEDPKPEDPQPEDPKPEDPKPGEQTEFQQRFKDPDQIEDKLLVDMICHNEANWEEIGTQIAVLVRHNFETKVGFATIYMFEGGNPLNADSFIASNVTRVLEEPAIKYSDTNFTLQVDTDKPSMGKDGVAIPQVSLGEIQSQFINEGKAIALECELKHAARGDADSTETEIPGESAAVASE